MAYAQQPQYDAVQGSYYEHQQASYASSQHPYTAEYDYAPGDQGGGFNGEPRPPYQPFTDDYVPNGGGSRHDQQRWQDSNGVGPGNNWRHGGRGGEAGGRPQMQQPRLKLEEPGFAYSDPRSRGVPRSKSRQPERTRYQQADQHYQPDGYRVPQYHPEDTLQDGLAGQGNRGYQYDYPSHDHGITLRTKQLYVPSMDRDQGHSNPQNDFEYQGQSYPGDYVQSNLQGDYVAGPVAPVSKYQEPPKSGHDPPPSIFSSSEALQKSKAPSRRAMETPISPDTVAWDNPFPTFPMRPKKGAHSSSQSLDGLAIDASLKDERPHDINYDNRPQTASSKSSSYTIPQRQITEQPIGHPRAQHDGYFDRKAGPQKDAEQNHAVAQERPRAHENGRGGRFDQLKPPVVTGRHSEDNRTRPSIPIDQPIDSGYERSRTMPTAIAEAAIKPSNRPRPGVRTNRQEPGSVAGYYGPEDKGFTPTSPVSPTQLKNYGQSRATCDERGPHGAEVLNKTLSPRSRQLHTPQDSLGDVIDNYYEAPQQDHQPYYENNRNQRRPPGDEDLPNFDAVSDLGTSHRRGMTIDKQLQLLQKSQEYPSMPDPPQGDGRKGQKSDAFASGSVPRSRSQPNLKDKRSPRQQHDDGFDFGVPGPSRRLPATAPTPSGYGPGANVNAGFGSPNERHLEREQYPRDPGYQGEIFTSGYRNGDPNMSNIPPPRTGPPQPMAYQCDGPPDGYRSPPVKEQRTYGPPPTAYQDNTQPGRYRSSPLQDGRHRHAPMRLPVGKPFPADRKMASVSSPNTFTGKSHSPPLQDGRSRDGQTRPPDGRPSPINRIGPGSPPIKSPSNPDALPSHPAPVRVGFMDVSPVNQAPKPAPVRQYNATPSPMQLSDPSQKPGSSRPHESKRESLPVTHQELEKLKQATARNPEDLATQLFLAKKLVEAASILVDERADPRTRSKSREKYILDAHKIVKMLSSSGYIEATFYLADCYTRGALGLEFDTREAFKLYQTAAKAGHAQAAYRVAVCCEIGQEEGGGTSRDAVKAMQWYKRAATLGDTPAMYKMGIISLKGLLGQQKNPGEAIVWLKRAAERADKENPHALHELGLLHENSSGNEGIAKDEAYSKQLFAQAAKLGYKFSQYRLGSAYEYGLIGCPVDPRQSIAWYSKAAVQEEHQSELALSGWYLTGSEGILQQSDTEAYLWARKAALAGLAKAEYAMGYFTEVGIGAPASLDDSKRWYWRAASQNFPKARDRLEDLRKGGPTKRKERVSRSNIRKSSEGECSLM